MQEYPFYIKLYYDQLYST